MCNQGSQYWNNVIENKNIELRKKRKMGRPKKFKAVDLKTTKLYDEVTKI